MRLVELLTCGWHDRPKVKTSQDVSAAPILTDAMHKRSTDSIVRARRKWRTGSFCRTHRFKHKPKLTRGDAFIHTEKKKWWASRCEAINDTCARPWAKIIYDSTVLARLMRIPGESCAQVGAIVPGYIGDSDPESIPELLVGVGRGIHARRDTPGSLPVR